MKTFIQKISLALALFAGAETQIHAQGTAFTYQGRLSFNGSAAAGSYDLRFALFNTNATGSQFGSAVTNPATLVTNGLFTVTLDFGPGIFTGPARWLEIAVQTNGGSGFTTLAPRQPLTAAPYAVFANAASNVLGTVATTQLTGSLPASQLSGAISAANIAPGSITGAMLGAGAAAANLAAGNQTAVPSGGVIMSLSGPQTQNLLNAGYIKIGTLNLVQENWTTNLSSGPYDTGELVTGRFGHSAVWTGTEMIIWGGWDGHAHNNGARYNPSANTWTIVNPNSGLVPRYLHTAVWTGSKMPVWGGDDGSLNSLNDGASYNPATDSWTPMSAANAPVGRDHATAVWTGTKMILWGGYTNMYVAAFGGYYVFVDVPNGGIYDPAANNWTAINNTGAPLYSIYHTAVWTGTNMIVWGGSATYVSGGRYNPTNNTWTAINTNNTSAGARHSHSAIWTGTNMIVWGGYNATQDTNTGAIYNQALNTWSPMSKVNAPSSRNNHSAIWTGTQMFVWGGCDDNQYPLGDGAIYDPALNSWTVMPTNNAPIPRDSHTAIWTGNSMLVWGGESIDPNYGYIGYPEPGGVFFPAFNLWSGIPYAPATGEPGARQSATAVWTGSEMLVWGGENSGFQLHTGGRYNPATDSWHPITTTNAPTARQGHTAVWTGNAMVIWGGQNGGSTYGNGGRYNPASDSWTTISTINAPLARANHVAVWTGTEMLVWGGFETTLLIPAAGGRYNPVTDTWITMNTTNQPLATAQSAGVWTGKELMVWGGMRSVLGTNFYNSGGRYNPTNDSWTLMSTVNAPTPRAGHTAVWSGTDYIVWGGYNSTTNLNNGARYTASTDTWTPLATTFAPPACSGHSAVWTGSKMLIYGGFVAPPYAYNDNVEIYDPVSNTWNYSLTVPMFSAAANACALWIGTGMLVWGGLADGQYSNQVFLYTPQQTMDLLLRP